LFLNSVFILILVIVPFWLLFLFCI